MIKKLVITYPPDFDGELHIKCELLPVSSNSNNLHVEFDLATAKEETERQALCRVAMDILRMFGKVGNKSTK